MKANFIKIQFLLLVVLSFNACDDVDLSYEVGDVRGIWEAYLEGTSIIQYVLIEDITEGSNFTFYNFDRSAGCVSTEPYFITRVDGNGIYIINQEEGVEGDRVVGVTRTGSARIDIREFNDEGDVETRYYETEVNIDELGSECPNEDIFSRWKLDDIDREVYLTISKEEINVVDFDSGGACYFSNSIPIDLIDGNTYYFTTTNENNEQVQEQAVMEVVDGVLKVSRTEQGAEILEDYLPSEVDLTTLDPMCGN